MAVQKRDLWLRRVLLVKVLVTLFVWGLPALIGPPAFLGLFGIEMPDDPTFLRLFGAVVTAMTLVYWYAYRDPIRNVAILKFGILDNGLSALTLVVLAFAVGIPSWFYWVSLVLLVFFCLAFVVLLPRGSEVG
jgi:hypothetical protein